MQHKREERDTKQESFHNMKGEKKKRHKEDEDSL